jgi:hypothetical protein
MKIEKSENRKSFSGKPTFTAYYAKQLKHSAVVEMLNSSLSSSGILKFKQIKLWNSEIQTIRSTQPMVTNSQQTHKLQ